MTESPLECYSNSYLVFVVLSLPPLPSHPIPSHPIPSRPVPSRPLPPLPSHHVTDRGDEFLHGMLQRVRPGRLPTPETILTELVAAAALTAVLEAGEARLLAGRTLHVVVHCNRGGGGT